MVREESQRGGQRRFDHDECRGEWEIPDDYFYACVGLAFRLDTMIILPSMVFRDLGVFIVIPYLVIMALCVVPVIFIQSFLGQFSNTGFMTVFRISPLFKGMSYVGLVLNIGQLAYYIVFAVIPLFYLLHSLRPIIPWSCEGSKDWMTPNKSCIILCDQTNDDRHCGTLEVSSVEFFRQHMSLVNPLQTHLQISFSWSLAVLACLVWIIIVIVLTKPVEVIGRYIRYTCSTSIIILLLCLLRFMFLPGASDAIKGFFRPKHLHNFRSWASISVVALSTKGPGWGVIISLASYNKFNRNISKQSWLLGLSQFGLIAGVAFLYNLTVNHLRCFNVELQELHGSSPMWLGFLGIGTLLTSLELPNLWSALYFTMLLLASFNLIAIQMLSILTASFDEFPLLRSIKRNVLLMTVSLIALASLYFCSNYGIVLLEMMSVLSGVAQTLLNLLLVYIVFWVHGKLRIQQELIFMTNCRYPGWMVTSVQLFTPLFLAMSFIYSLWTTVTFHYSSSGALFYTALTLVSIPWLFVPVTCIYKLRQESGSLTTRIRRCINSKDWYPPKFSDRQRYEETIGNPNI